MVRPLYLKQYESLIARRDYLKTMSENAIASFGEEIQTLCDEVLSGVAKTGHDISSSYKVLYHCRKLASRMREIQTINEKEKSIAIQEMYDDLKIDLAPILQYIDLLPETEPEEVAARSEG
jgi:hypothetical protein